LSLAIKAKMGEIEKKSEENIKLTEEKKEAKSGVSRRGFIQGAVAGVVVGAAATYGATQMMQPPTAPPTAPPTGVEEVVAGKRTVSMTVNGEPVSMEVQSNWTLLYVLREKMKLTGTKVTCDYGECGACTVIINGKSALACMSLAVRQDGADIQTIESLAQGGNLHPIQQAFIDKHGYSCGYCIPGIIMSAKALLDKNPGPSDDEIKEGISGNICRCTGYIGPVRAIKAAAGMM
jgi:aerobic-type carbon monoxide dehydrogenase small subunit (CoxS/CutS family)